MSEQDRMTFEEWAKDHEYAIDDYVYALEIWNAATAEANKRMAELELQLQNWKDFSKKVQKIAFNDYLQLQASNHDLREALDNIVNTFYEETDVAWMRQCYDLMELGKQALSATPAESLQPHDDELLERAAKLCDRFIKQEHSDGNSATTIMLIQNEIRSLKEVK